MLPRQALSRSISWGSRSFEIRFFEDLRARMVMQVCFIEVKYRIIFEMQPICDTIVLQKADSEEFCPHSLYYERRVPHSIA